ncbi:MAG TPA: nuclear transport factor 2 family protein [Ignavibacteriaceae bacterium]
MKKFSIYNLQLCVLCFFVFIFFTSITQETSAQEKNLNDSVIVTSEIRASLNKLNEVLATKDLKTVMSIYDDSDDITVIGSDSGEVFIGRSQVQKFMKIIISMPFVFSFVMEPVTISFDQNIAWVFVDGKMVHTRDNGKISKFPYRIMAVMVKRGNEWKWKVFSGSIPRGE